MRRNLFWPANALYTIDACLNQLPTTHDMSLDMTCLLSHHSTNFVTQVDKLLNRCSYEIIVVLYDFGDLNWNRYW